MAFIRLVLRIAGLFALAAAFVAFVVDGTRVIAGGPLVATSDGQAIAAIDPGVLDAWAKGGHGPFVDAVVAFLLGAPAFAALAILGVALMLLGRRRRRRFAEPSWRT